MHYSLKQPNMRNLLLRFLVVLILMVAATLSAQASILTPVHGVVHDPSHRPIRGARVTLKAANSALQFAQATGADGIFHFASVPVGVYIITVKASGFATRQQEVTVTANSQPVLHFALTVATVQQSTTVHAEASALSPDSMTPTTLISRKTIAQTPGASRTNSLAMITDYVPGAYVVHDMLHMRGGHQLSWLIDGVEIPNTNIASNIGPAIDPKDIDYLDVERGSYEADLGDRTYGMMDIVPRTGFEYNRAGQLVLSAGNYGQTNDQISLGNHTERFAWYLSVNGNRSSYGLMPPVAHPYHDAENGYGGFNSIIYNPNPKNQLRVVSQLRTDYYQIPYDPNPSDYENQLDPTSQLRDGEHETDGLIALTWAHSFDSLTTLNVSPFYHYNRANYQPGKNDAPAATSSDQTGNYAGLQASIATVIAKNSLKAGLYSYVQHENDFFGSTFADGTPAVAQRNRVTGGIAEFYAEDSYKPSQWVTFFGGVRESYFSADVTENYVYPRVGLAVEIPRLHWIFRAFYGRFYQPPPLTSVSGPLLQYAQASNTSFVPLHGERDEEHQFGVTIPLRGWTLSADTFETRANNFLDHSNIGESSIFIPVTIDGALVQAWELTLRSPQMWKYGQVHLAYSNQLAQQRGAITGGLICYPPNSPDCAASQAYTPLDHDQRNTLNAGYNAHLPSQSYASINVYYGSGFSNGVQTAQYPGNYLPQHTTIDLAAGKHFGSKYEASITALNVDDSRVLLDNSLTFGGFHYNAPPEVYGEVRYNFHF
ncbi:MAG TPA: TonB-dependent receptor [Acidobacterium sp.]|uniref:TonB-dependent receptor n=2 Tax=Acidobacteriaceae TaxID=204434 RepID=C1F3A3_ACIC5|nr:TonB-dependent receptor [Acidobacterium capsulatum ATCC 51196]HCT60613.1 TonB-dependent receptor [Acidobacterium sp.]